MSNTDPVMEAVSEIQAKKNKREEQENIKTEIQLTMREFLESKPLYVKVKTKLTYYFHQGIPDLLELYCKTCKNNRPFRQPRVFGGSGAGMPPPARSSSGLYGTSFLCSGCENEKINYYIYAHFDIPPESNFSEGYVMKIGQYPMWFPVISKELKEAFGDDVELYQKALRNMNEGYGIGACAYFRRLIEKYINPLLELLHDVKQEQGETQEKLDEIKDVMKGKDFSSKTKYASEIAPSVIIVQGHNPLKEIHERLSIGLHSLDDDKAIEYATVIKGALEFIIPRLRREYEERKEFLESLKSTRKLS